MKVLKNSSYKELNQQQLRKIDGGFIPFVVSVAKGVTSVGEHVNK